MKLLKLAILSATIAAIPLLAQQPVSLQALAGTTLGAPSNYGTSPGAVTVMGVNAFVTNTVTTTISGTPAVSFGPVATSGGALTPLTTAAVTTSVTVKASAGNLYGATIYNPNTSACFMQFFNTTSPTLGTTPPITVIPVQAGVTAYVNPGPMALANFSTAIAEAATTTATGASTCTTGMQANVYYF